MTGNVSEKNTFVSYGLFLISFFLNLVVFVLFLLARVVWGGFAAVCCLSRFALKSAFVFLCLKVDAIFMKG